jgi:hypothetical protein
LPPEYAAQAQPRNPEVLIVGQLTEGAGDK